MQVELRRARATRSASRRSTTHTLQVKLTSPQPWFVQQVAHHVVPGRQQARPSSSTATSGRRRRTSSPNGPFKLADVEARRADRPGQERRLARRRRASASRGSRAGSSSTARPPCRRSRPARSTSTRRRLPPARSRVSRRPPEYEKYEALGTYYYGFNLKNIPDVNQRRAMAFAIDRKEIIDNIAQADQVPGHGLHAAGHAGLRRDQQELALAARDGRHGAGQGADGEGRRTRRRTITLYYNNSPGHTEIAIAVQAMWKKLGHQRRRSRQQEWAQFLEFLGPPPNKRSTSTGSAGSATSSDAINFLELWTCDSGNNNTDFCNKEYDELIDKARKTPDNAGALRDLRAGSRPCSPARTARCRSSPIYWYTYIQPRAASDQGHVHHQPARPDRPHQGRRVTRRRRRHGSERAGRRAAPGPRRLDAARQGKGTSMTRFIIRRILWTIPVILLVILMTFMMMRQIGGNPFRHGERAVPAAIQANLDRKFHLDEPWYVAVLRLREGRRSGSTSARRSCCATSASTTSSRSTSRPRSSSARWRCSWRSCFGIPLGVIAALKAEHGPSTTWRWSSRTSATRYRAS